MQTEYTWDPASLTINVYWRIYAKARKPPGGSNRPEHMWSLASPTSPSWQGA